MGFRPLFLAAAAFACVATSMWLHALITGRDPSAGYLFPTYWHAHEMLFGFTLAVIAGFLLTAARNWTGRDTLHGYPLGALVALWLLGRLAMAGALPLPRVVVATTVVAFPALLTVVIARVIIGARSRRNFGIVALLTALTAASLAVHLDVLGTTTRATGPALHGALHLIVLLNVIIGGRIVPLFTRNRTGDQAVRNVRAVDHAALGAALLVAVLAVLQMATQRLAVTWALAATAAVSGVLQLIRMRTWGTIPALRIPMLAVLHAGYAWIGLGHLLLALALVKQGFALSVALHALTIGVIGTMTLGMMARVTLGHTGRTIEASPLQSIAFILMNLAVLARLAAPLLPVTEVRTTWIVSGTLFSLAFVAYLVTALGPLTTRRPDGRPG